MKRIRQTMLIMKMIRIMRLVIMLFLYLLEIEPRSLLVGKPRHERKYPLIIPTAIAQALSQHSVSVVKNEPTYLGLEDDPPEDTSMKPCENNIGSNSVVKTESHHNQQQHQRSFDTGNQVGFEERIANSFDLLDEMEECSSSEAEDVMKTVSATPVNVESVVVDGVGCPLVDNGVAEGDSPTVEEDSPEKNDEEQRLMSVMADVLGAKVSPHVCSESLKATNYDVHRAIKLARLRALIVTRNDPTSEQRWDINTGLETLRANNWDVGRAALDIYGPRV
ncbi:hypothetical protein O3M35_001428 [Rhynocoris fuscipes]|uniref:Uncharacterized protein n=1 Tax=Rhynocoris fuscipes TaxID=488301 RepID=A0AAW1CQU9_9HEMI